MSSSVASSPRRRFCSGFVSCVSSCVMTAVSIELSNGSDDATFTRKKKMIVVNRWKMVFIRQSFINLITVYI